MRSIDTSSSVGRTHWSCEQKSKEGHIQVGSEARNMKALIEVKSRQEGDAIRSALEDKEMRAMAVVLGTLRSLTTDRVRKRVLEFALDKLDEQKELALEPPTPLGQIAKEAMK
jgi:hypothetical protein